jgi:hypothetical protein
MSYCGAMRSLLWLPTNIGTKWNSGAVVWRNVNAWRGPATLAWTRGAIVPAFPFGGGRWPQIDDRTGMNLRGLAKAKTKSRKHFAHDPGLSAPCAYPDQWNWTNIDGKTF